VIETSTPVTKKFRPKESFRPLFVDVVIRDICFSFEPAVTPLLCIGSSLEAMSESEKAKSNGGGGGGTAKSLAALAQKFAGPALSVASVVIPAAILAVSKVHAQFRRLPQNVINFIYGFVVCFFGGTFPTLFAALQAAKHGGRQTVAKALSDLSSEVLIIIEHSKKVRRRTVIVFWQEKSHFFETIVFSYYHNVTWFRL